MQAIVIRQFGGPEVMKVEEAVTPGVKSGTVLVRLHAIGVNPVDTYIRAGAYGSFQGAFTPGYDGAGVIEAVGDLTPADVARGLAVGRRVYVARPPVDSAPGVFTGTYAQYVLTDAAGVHPLPDKISFAQGAGVGTPYGTAWRALFQRASARAGQTVLVHGASGGVGLAAVQIARAAGMVVIGTAGTPEGLEIVRSNGAAFAANHRDAGYLKQIKAFTGGRGPDVILEMLANVNLQKDLDIIAKFGVVVVIGSRGSLDFAPRGTMAKDASVVGMSLRNAPLGDFAQMHAAVGAGLATGIYTPIVSLELPLAEAARAHARVLEPAVHGKIVLKP
jgi:NADPH2:quinone reductase